MSKQDNKVLVSLFGLFLTSILFLRYFSGAPIIARDSSYVFLLEHAVGQIIAQLPTIMLVSIPVIIGMITMYCMCLLFDRMGLERRTKQFTALFFALTPVVSTTFTTYSEALFFIPLILLSVIVSEKYASIPLLGAVMITPLPGVIAAILVASYLLHKNKLLFASVCVLPIIVGFIFFETYPFVWTPLFGEFASINGYSLFLLLLGVVALIEHWKTLNITNVLFWTALFLLSGYVVELRILLVIPLAVYVSNSLLALFAKEWTLTFLRQASTILLVCVALFVFITQVQLLVNEHPSANLQVLLEDIEDSSREGAVLTTNNLAGYSSYFLTREVVSFDTDDELWSSIRMSEAGPVLTENDIRYLLLEQRIRETGFFFLITTNDKFVRLLSQERYETWLVLQEYVPGGSV